MRSALTKCRPAWLTAPRSLGRTSTVILGLSLAACGGGEKPADSPTEDEVQMAAGLEALYTKSDPFTAADAFRAVRLRTPTHYGAQFQLAVALDSGGYPELARPEWQRMRQMAEAIGDSATLRRIQARLAESDASSDVALVRRGVRELHVLGDPSSASATFRRVLARTPTHYGATYQLATALDRTGRAREAREYWTRMLGMATAVGDTATANVARARLQRQGADAP